MTAAISDRPTPILCALGRHRAGRRVHWNEGFYFTRCQRCGRDLVRTAYGRWHVPVGARVVWGGQRPERSIVPELVAEQAPPPDASPVPAPAPIAPTPVARGEELPIEEVLRHLKGSGEAGAAVQPPAPRRGRTYIPDFMADANADTSWRTNRPPNWPPAATAPKAAPTPEPQTVREPGVRPASETAPAKRVVVAATIGASLLLFVLLVAGRGSPGHAAPREAIVTADTATCRSAPDEGAAGVTQLLRGDRVRVLARDGQWVGVGYGRTQCWAPARHLVTGVPL